MTEATDAYRAEMDTIGEFLEDNFVTEPGANVATAELYRIYKLKCEEANERSMSRKALAGILRERGFTPHKLAGGIRVWAGLRKREIVNEEGHEKSDSGAWADRADFSGFSS